MMNRPITRNGTSTAERFRIAFFGTPTFAVPALSKLLSLDFCEVVAVVTQPDQPSGRGHKLTPPAVKAFAIEHGISVYQPHRLRGIVNSNGQYVAAESDTTATVAFVDFLNNFSETNPSRNALSTVDLGVVVAYGKIVPPLLLSYPRRGMLNIHGSLLPRWRGAAPIHRALMAGDSETGVCLMQLEEGLDTGPVYATARTPIDENDDFGSLHDRLAQIGADLLGENLLPILNGTKHPVPQREEGVTYAEKWQRSESRIDWKEPAEQIVRRIRVCSPSPGAFTELSGEIVKIYRASIHEDRSLLEIASRLPVGSVVESNRAELIISCGSGGLISVEEMQFSGRKRLPISEILKSRQLPKGSIFGSQHE